MWFYGASNALGHKIGAILVSPDKQYIPIMARLCFDCTNNIADYIRKLMGLFDDISFHHIPREEN